MSHGSDDPPLSRLIPIYLVIFIGFAGYSLMIAVFTPLFINGGSHLIAADMSAHQRMILLGFVLMMYPIGQFLSSPIFGALSDHFGRKPVLLVSLVCCVIGYLLIASSVQWHLLTLLFISNFITGLTEGNVVTAQSVITDVTVNSSEATRNYLFGFINLAASSAYIVAPLVGGKLTDSHVCAWFSDATPFWVVAALILINLIWVAFQLQETLQKEDGSRINYYAAFTNIASIFTSKNLRKTYFINFLAYMAIFGFFRSYPMYVVDKFHLNASEVSEYIAWVAVPILICAIWLNKFFAKHFSVKTITMASCLSMGIFITIVTFFTSRESLWFTLFIAAFPIALCMPAMVTLLTSKVSASEQGAVVGNNQSLAVAAEGISGGVAGFLAAMLIALPLWGFAACGIIAGIMLALSSD